MPRSVTLPDAAYLTVVNKVALNQMLGLSERRPIDRLEGSTLAALIGIVLIAAAGTLFWQIGVPYLSDAAAGAVSANYERKLANQTLESMEASTVLQPTALPQDHQINVVRAARSMAGPDLDSPQVLLRKSESMGPNAIALPGGTIVISDDLSSLLTLDEIAAVTAHELGHLHYHHPTRLMLRTAGMGMTTAVMLGHMDALSQEQSLPTMVYAAQYSQEFESQADAYAVDLLKQHQLSPCLLASALTKLEQYAQSRNIPGQPAPSTWFLTHPTTQQRLAALGKDCQSLP